MENRTVIVYGGELYHHGILGMKWGKKNGPPYPLDPEDHSASEKKAGWKKSLKKELKNELRNAKAERDAANQKNYDKHLKKYVEGVKSGKSFSKEESEADSSKYNAQFEKDTLKYKNRVKEAKATYKEELKKAGNDPSKKMKVALAVGAGLAVAGLAAYGAYKISETNSGKIANRFMEKQQKGENWIASNSIKYMKDHAYNDVLSSYTEYENPYVDTLKKLENKYDKNIYNKITKRNSSMLPSYTVKGSISGTLNDNGNRMDFVERKTRNIGSYDFVHPEISKRYNISDYEKDSWLARKRK